MGFAKWTIALILLGLAGIGQALADRGHGHGGHGHAHAHVGIVFGPYWGLWYPSPYYYYYPPYYSSFVVEHEPPPVYIEQPRSAPVDPSAAATAPENYWYYCSASKSYYPYVKDCPGGWQRVLPQPSGTP